MTTWMICDHGCVTTEPEHFTGEHVCFREVNLSDSLTAISVAQFRAYAKKRALEHRQMQMLSRYEASMVPRHFVTEAVNSTRMLGLVIIAALLTAFGVGVWMVMR